MSAQPDSDYPAPMTEADYLDLLRESDIKYEFIDGDIYAMSGASEAHIDITGNIFASLHAQLRRKPCRVYQADMRVRVTASGAYTYPDVSVVCGQREFTPDEAAATLLNPTLLIEVLSPSTMVRDKVTKLAHYTQIDSLQDYLLVAQDAPRIERYSRQPEGWLYTITDSQSASLTLASIGAQLALTEVYERVTFGGSE